jgi:hypothetical protein
MRHIPIELFAKRLHADLQAIQENLGDLRHVLDSIEKHIQSIESGYKASRETVEPSPQLLPIEIRHPIPKEPSEKARERSEGARHWVLLGLEFSVFIVTIAIAVFAYGQWVEMAGATGAAKKSADAAERAARSAEVATIKAMESEKLSQRAWVGVSEMHYSVVPNRTSALAVYITNVGRTPALEVESKIRVFHQDRRSENPSLERTRANVGWVVMPGARYHATVNGPVFSEEQLKSDSWRVYLIGAIWYKDVFGDTHRTRFCSRLVLDENGNKRYPPCGFHDDAN